MGRAALKLPHARNDRATPPQRKPVMVAASEDEPMSKPQSHLITWMLAILPVFATLAGIVQA
jgi:hypothetical protein